MYCKLATRFANARKLLHQVMILVLAIVSFMVVLNIMLGIDIFRGSKSLYTTEIYFAAAAAINDLIFLSANILTFYFPKCPKCTRRRIASRVFQRKEEKSKEYGTFKESDHVSLLATRSSRSSILGNSNISLDND